MLYVGKHKHKDKSPSIYRFVCVCVCMYFDVLMRWNERDDSLTKRCRSFGHEQVNSVEWVDRSLLSASSDGTTSLWDVRERPWKASLTIDVGAIVYSATATSSSKIVLSTVNCDIIAYDYRAGGSANSLWKIDTLLGPARRIKTSPHDDHICAAGTDSPSTLVFDSNSGTILSELVHHTDFVRGIAWNPETRGILYCGSWDKTVSMVKLKL